MAAGTARQRAVYDEPIEINGVGYLLDEDPQQGSAFVRRQVPTQPGDPGVEFERYLVNLALGWGNSRWVSGGYDYGDGAVLHRRKSWLPGSAVTTRTPGGGGSELSATAAIGRVSFCEFWDPADSTARRLVVVSPRHVYEVNSSGSVATADLGVNFTTSRAMTKGVLFFAAGMAAPTIMIARQSTTATDYFVRRTGAGTYALSGANKMALAIARGKDSAGADICWRVDENGKLNASIPDTDPSNSAANWASTTYATGPNTGRVNDLCQQARAMLVGREDGAFTFDNVINAVPVTPGMEQTPSANQFRYFKDSNGMALAPTAQGIVWIDGLEWGACGPVSSNPVARNLRGTEVFITDQAGEYIYAGVYSGGNTYIFVGTPHREGETGRDPFSWHGPIAKVAWEASDGAVSTVWSTRLWIGGVGGQVATIDLNADFSPKSDASSGYIYLPEGWLDMDGPGAIKDLRKAEFVAPASAPFAATNQWTIEIETTPGSGTYTAIDGGVVGAGGSVYAERFWTTETSGRRLRGRIAYSGNTGTGELEAVIVRGTQRPEYTEEYDIRIRLRDGAAKPSGNRRDGIAQTDSAALRALLASGRVTGRIFQESGLTVQVVKASEVITVNQGLWKAPKRVMTVTVRKVKTS